MAEDKRDDAERTQRKRLYRSDDALIAGVCGGIAEYYSIDAPLVRVLAVLLLLLGAGAPALIYLVLAICLPKEAEDYSAPVDIAPVLPSKRAAAASAKLTYDESGRIVGAPVPPSDFVASVGAAAVGVAAGVGGAAPVPPAVRQELSSPGAAYAASYGIARDASDDNGQLTPLGWFLLMLGTLLVSLGLGIMLHRFDRGFFWGGFLPLPLLLAGILLAFSKGKKGHSQSRIIVGGIIVVLSIFLLANSTGVLHWRFWGELVQAWPFAIVALGLFMVGYSLDSNWVRGLAVVALLLGALLSVGDYLLGMPSPYENPHQIHMAGPADGDGPKDVDATEAPHGDGAGVPSDGVGREGNESGDVPIIPFDGRDLAPVIKLL